MAMGLGMTMRGRPRTIFGMSARPDATAMRCAVSDRFDLCAQPLGSIDLLTARAGTRAQARQRC
jgi:hypothetical protein